MIFENNLTAAASFMPTFDTVLSDFAKMGITSANSSFCY
uniref:Uncharacterized protein n=1 Tax=Arundo donax TaxID=35708 RepID=A0A0A9FSJ1_ARUDO